jgi:hypothetical protein
MKQGRDENEEDDKVIIRLSVVGNESDFIDVEFTQLEYAIIEQDAREAGLSIEALIRRRALPKP